MFVELVHLDYAYYHLLQYMDDGSKRFKKFHEAKMLGKSSQKKEDDVAQSEKEDVAQSGKKDDVAQTQSSNHQTTASDVECDRAQVEYYQAAFKNSVLKKGHANPTTDELNFVRDHMRQFNSSDQEFFAMFQTHFGTHNPQFAIKFKYMLNDDCNEVIKWMKDCLIPFGKQLLSWCDGGRDKTLDQSLYCCNGNHFHNLDKLSNAVTVCREICIECSLDLS
jgi:hypothetical protein